MQQKLTFKLERGLFADASEVTVADLTIHDTLATGGTACTQRRKKPCRLASVIKLFGTGQIKMSERRESPFGRTLIGAVCLLSLACGVIAATSQAHASPTAIPAAIAMPDLVTEPTVNLGNTSYYDGFGKFDGGWVIIDYARWQHLTSISDSKGNAVTAFRNPDIEALSNVIQPVWVSSWHPFGGGVGVTALLPLVDLSSSFTQPGANLRANGFALGDLTWGPFYQARPTTLFGHVFSYRLEFDILSPIGGFNRTKDIDQSSRFWSINPYIAMTYLPASGVELSSRIYYLYNFPTSTFPNPPALPRLASTTGRAGQAVWANYDASCTFSKLFSLGINGYYFQQITNDQINRTDLPHSIKNQLYLGPGFHWNLTPNNIINANLYLPVTTHGVANGPQLSFQFIHPF